MELIGTILRGIWDNFNCVEGKLIVGSLINLILIVVMYGCIKAREGKAFLHTGLMALANSLVFAAWSLVHPGAPGLLAALKVLGTAPLIVIALGAAALCAGKLLSLGSTGGSQPSGDQVIYDRNGMPIDLHRVEGHWEDRRGDRYEVYGDHASAQQMYLETEDGDTVCVTPEGNGCYSSYGHSYRLNGRGKLEEY